MLKIAWIVTAFVAIVVLIVYFIKLNGLYKEQQETLQERKLSAEAEKKNNADTATDEKGDAGKNPDEGKNDAITDKPVAENPETGKDTPAVTEEPSKDKEGENPTDTPEKDSGNTEAAEGEGKEGNSQDTPATEDGDITGEDNKTDNPDEKSYVSEQYHGVDPSKPMVALSFDDGPSIYTERILKKLAEYGAHATFFMVGENVDRYPELVRLVNSYDCEIGNHTLDHATLTKLSKDKIIANISGNQQKINEALGFETKCIVRPPGGGYNNTVKNNAGMPLVCWSVDSEDWKSRNADAVFKVIKEEANDGCIILCHDLYESTADAVDMFVPWLVEQGYQICNITDMYSSRGEFQEAGHVYRHTMTAEEFLANQEQAQ